MNPSDVPTTLSAALARMIEILVSADVEAPRRNAEWILQDLAGISRLDLITHSARPISAEAWTPCLHATLRRANREPIQYILGYADFFGLRINVSPEVLIPRPETEQVAAELLARLDGQTCPRVLDVGTGSGCIAVALAHARPDARLFACDSEAGALRVAHQNASELRVKIQLFKADALSAGFAVAFSGVLDAIVSNPPYVAAGEVASLEPEVRDFEPRAALVAAPDPLIFYRALAREAGRVLRVGGHLVLECHEERTEAVARLLSAEGMGAVQALPDLAGRARIVTGRVMERV